jgi:hypothetical protein
METNLGRSGSIKVRDSGPWQRRRRITEVYWNWCKLGVNKCCKVEMSVSPEAVRLFWVRNERKLERILILVGFWLALRGCALGCPTGRLCCYFWIVIKRSCPCFLSAQELDNTLWFTCFLITDTYLFRILESPSLVFLVMENWSGSCQTNLYPVAHQRNYIWRLLSRRILLHIYATSVSWINS